MPITPAAPYPKGPGDSILSADWNQAVDEVIRLDNAKLNVTGGGISGNLAINGTLRLGPGPVTHKLSVDVGTMAAPGNGIHLRSVPSTTADLRIRLEFDNTSGASHFLFDDGSDTHSLDLESANDLAFNTGGPNERMRITTGGQVGIGILAPTASLHIDGGALTVGPVTPINGQGHFAVSGPQAEVDFVRRSLAAWPAVPAAGDRYVWYNQSGTAALFTDVNGDLLRVDANGNLSLKKTDGNFASIAHSTFDNEATFKTNLKVIMGNTGLIFGGAGLQYEFMVGHTFFGFILGGGSNTNFVRSFSIDEAGALRCGGSKGGYVVDNFLNASGDTLEEGDVVVLSGAPVEFFTGIGSRIPLPEVDLTDKAYDTRLCGVVDKVVFESGLPYVEPQIDTKETARFTKAFDAWKKDRVKNKKSSLSLAGGGELDLSPETFMKEDGSFKVAGPEATRHPLADMAAPSAADMTKVTSHQIGDMVTLGAYSFCKVDADIAPIEPGDLLTTSPTKGHAQKVLDPGKASGAILGKALGSLKKGKGKIPVLVSFH